MFCILAGGQLLTVSILAVCDLDNHKLLTPHGATF
jgi:hypothetical protein